MAGERAEVSEDGDLGSAAPLPLYPPRTRAGLDPSQKSDFNERLCRFRLAANGSSQPGATTCVQELDLEQIKLRFGRRWGELGEKILGIIEGAIYRELGADDLYAAVTETRFLVLRSGVKRAEAERRGQLLVADITQRLCGAVPGSTAAEIRTLPLDPGAGLSGCTDLPDLLGRIATVSRAIDAAEKGLFADNVARLRACWQPTLHLRRKLVSAYHLRPCLASPDGKLRPAKALCESSLNGLFDAEVDAWVLDSVRGVLMRHGGAERPALLLAPVHYGTLARRQLRGRWLEKLRLLPPSARRWLILEVVGIPPALVQSRVRALMSFLAHASIAIYARLPADVAYAEHLQNAGVRGISIDRGEIADDDDVAEIVAMHAANARRHGMRCLLVGARSARDCQTALMAGIDQLNGDGFMRPVREPVRAGRRSAAAKAEATPG